MQLPDLHCREPQRGKKLLGRSRLQRLEVELLGRRRVKVRFMLQPQRVDSARKRTFLRWHPEKNVLKRKLRRD